MTSNLLIDQKPVRIANAAYRSLDAEEYLNTPLHGLRENPFFLAMPPMVKIADYGLLGTNLPPHDLDMNKFTKEDRILMAQSIRSANIATLMHYDLYRQIYTMICYGYESRNPLTPKTVKWHYDIARNHAVAETTSAATFLITGISGTGKTTAINNAMHFFPDVIEHSNFQQQFKQKQIIFLRISIPNNASIRALYKSILLEIDRLIGTDYYKLSIQSRVTNDELKTQILSILITYGVGLLIIDELQKLSLAKSGGEDEILAFFDDLTSKSKVPIITIGTPQSALMFSKNFTTGRRIAISGSVEFTPFSRDSKSWEIMSEKMFSLQFTLKKQPLSDAILSALHDCSQGIPYVLSRLVEAANIDAIKSGTEKITATQIEKIYRGNFKLIKNALHAYRNKKLKNYIDLMSISELLEQAENTTALKQLKQLLQNTALGQTVKADIIEEIASQHSFTDSEREYIETLKNLKNQ